MKDALPEGEYRKTMSNLIDDTIFVSTAWKDGVIIGVDGLNRRRMGVVSGFWPIVRGYTAVSKPYQGRGIGTIISGEKEGFLAGAYLFHESVVKIHNDRMLKINAKKDYVALYRDERLNYSIKAYNGVMKLFSPGVVFLYRAYKRLRHRA